MKKKEILSVKHFLDSALELLYLENPAPFRDQLKLLQNKLIKISIADSSEYFFLIPQKTILKTSSKSPKTRSNVLITLSPQIMLDIMEGKITPIEAFFAGELRATGPLEELYSTYRLIVHIAELFVSIPETIKLASEFKRKIKNEK